jgi:hypothetical protein
MASSRAFWPDATGIDLGGTMAGLIDVREAFVDARAYRRIVLQIENFDQ